MHTRHWLNGNFISLFLIHSSFKIIKIIAFFYSEGFPYYIFCCSNYFKSMELKYHTYYEKMYSSSGNRFRTRFLVYSFTKVEKGTCLRDEFIFFVINNKIGLLFQGGSFWGHKWIFMFFKIFWRWQLIGSKCPLKMCDFKRVLAKETAARIGL